MTSSEFRRTLSSDLARAVVGLVNDNRLEAGDPLESVKLLAARFDVAVPTMREALRRLEGLGVLEFRHGSGIYVGANAGRRVLANPLSPAPEQGQLVELLEARLQIEPPLARLAAKVRDKAGLAWMEETLARARQQVTAGDNAVWLTNLDFHRAVATTGGNTILAEVLDSIMLIHAAEQREILHLHGDAEKDFDEHASLAAAIREGKPEHAAEVAHRHLDLVTEIVRARI